jgi:hypothetical protein
MSGQLSAVAGIRQGQGIEIDLLKRLIELALPPKEVSELSAAERPIRNRNAIDVDARP